MEHKVKKMYTDYTYPKYDNFMDKFAPVPHQYSLGLFPEEIKELLESVQSFLMLRSNIWASESISYFGIGVGYKPLIHFWSLSIELQFYIFFPILLYFCLKNEAKLFLIIIVVIIFLVSLFYAIFWIEYNPSQGYFSSLMRVWQFSLGGILSLSGITSVVNSTSVKIRSTKVSPNRWTENR